VTPGFKAAYAAAINVAVIQGLSSPVSCATRAGLNAAANPAQTGEFNAVASQDLSATLNPAVNRAASRAMSSGLTCAFNRELNSALNPALNLPFSSVMSAEVNEVVPVRVL
jgi:hypothetical protein